MSKYNKAKQKISSLNEQAMAEMKRENPDNSLLLTLFNHMLLVFDNAKFPSTPENLEMRRRLLENVSGMKAMVQQDSWPAPVRGQS